MEFRISDIERSPDAVEVSPGLWMRTKVTEKDIEHMLLAAKVLALSDKSA